MTVDMLGAFERHVMPSGVEVFYRDSDHSYWSEIQEKAGKWSGVQSARLAGVTTAVAPFDWRPDNLMRWAARLNGEGVAALAAEGLGCEDLDDMRCALDFLRSGESIWSALEEARLLFTDARDDAAQRGTNVHKDVLHVFAQGKPFPDLSRLTAEEQGYGFGIVDFWHEREPEPLLAEQIVFDPEHRIAGRLDLISWVTLDSGERALGLLDAKTSGFIPTKHHVQIIGYKRCARLSGFEFPAPLVPLILQVTPEGRHELIPVTAVEEDFVAAVDVYRRAARIGRDLTAARKAASEAIAA
jgi:hypothetical protein